VCAGFLLQLGLQCSKVGRQPTQGLGGRSQRLEGTGPAAGAAFQAGAATQGGQIGGVQGQRLAGAGGGRLQRAAVGLGIDELQQRLAVQGL